MLAITVLQRFLSLILAPTPFPNLFVSPLPVLAAPLTDSALVSAIAVPAVEGDSQEVLPIADITETTHLLIASSHLNQPQTPTVTITVNPTISDITVSSFDEDVHDALSVSVSDEEEDDYWELSSNEGSDITSPPSCVTSDDMTGEPFGFFTFHPNVSIEDIHLYPEEDSCASSDSNNSNPYQNDVPIVPTCIKPSTFVTSAVPRRACIVLEEENAYTSTPEALQIAPESIDDIDEIENYNAEWLTPRALEEAKSRSRKIQRAARMRALDLAKVIPLKAHEHPEPQSRCAPSVLKRLGRSSPLRNSFNMGNLEEDTRQQAILECSWAEEEEDILPDLQDLKSFFKARF